MIKHGMDGSPECRAWQSARQRCRNPRDKVYPRYGARGIRVCQRWEIFQNFFDDMGPRPSKGHSLDRINNDGDYEPGNCRWATRHEQQQNKRNTRTIVYRGETIRLATLCETRLVSGNDVRRRLRRRWSVEAAVDTPPRKYGKTNSGQAGMTAKK